MIGIFSAGIYQQFPPPPNSYSTHPSSASHIPQPHHPLIHFHSPHTFPIFPTPEIMCFTIGPSGYKLPPGFETPPGFLRAAAAKAAAQAAAAENSTGDKNRSSPASAPAAENFAPRQGENGKSFKACLRSRMSLGCDKESTAKQFGCLPGLGSAVGDVEMDDDTESYSMI